MPRRRERPSLVDLCLQNIVENVIYHSNMYEKFANDEKVQLHYYIFQYLFSDHLLEKLCFFHNQTCKSSNGFENQCLADFLFKAGMWSANSSLKSCWDFIFNRYLKKISLACPSCMKKGIPMEIVSHILSNCKNPEQLDLSECILDEAQFLEAVPHWNNLVRLDLSHSPCTNEMVCRIWECLTELEHLNLESCSKISNECLLYLCKHRSNNGKFSFCKESGSCCKLGKKLKSLSVSGTRITDSGIMYALLHLVSLKIFSHDTKTSGVNTVSFAALTISDASTKHRKKRQPRVRFQLKGMYCDKHFSPGMIRKVLSACPYLRELTLCTSAKSLEVFVKCPAESINSMFLRFPSSRTLNSSTFQKFLLKNGENLVKLKVTVEKGSMKTRHIVEMLRKCKNLREFSIGGSLSIAGINENIIPDIPTSVENLEVLDLSAIELVNVKHIDFFVEIMKQVINLKTLMMSYSVAKIAMVQALQTNDFSSLEKIVIKNADMNDISLESFVNKQNNLKKITLYICKNTKTFLEKHREIVRKNHFSLDIVCQLCQSNS